MRGKNIPSSKWNENAGFVAEPLRSTEKKLEQGDYVEGTPSKPLLILDWSNIQIARYCDDCGITLSDSNAHMLACIDHIRMLERARSVPPTGQAETSCDVRDAKYVLMNIICWNVRVLGRLAKRYLIQDFLNIHWADVYYLQESKLEKIPLPMWRVIGGNCLDQYVFLPAKGTTSGIIIGWNNTALSDKLILIGDFNVTVDFCFLRTNFCRRCTKVYGPNARALKQSFCQELRACEGPAAVPWIICGEFNAILALEDKDGGLQNLEDIRNANIFL